MDKPISTLDQRKDRRGLLALIGAGGAAAVAALLGRSNGAQAHGTLHHDSGDSNPALHGDNSANGVGVQGDGNTGYGVYGSSSSSNGVGGFSSSGPGVGGLSTSGNGVLGTSTSGNGVGGWSSSGTGVKGESASATGVKGTGNPGVYGFGGNATGVKGEGKYGVIGKNSTANGVGVRGVGNGASGSMGVHAKNSATKRALRTQGRVQMDCARTKSLSNKSNLVTLPSGVNAGSKVTVLATMQGSPGNDALIQRAFRVDSKRIRIVFNKKPANPTAVGYWVVHTG